MHEFAMVCAGLASGCLALWIVLTILGGRDETSGARLDVVSAATFGSLALASLVLLRVVVEVSPRDAGPLPVFVFLGVPLGLGLVWITLRLRRERRSRGVDSGSGGSASRNPAKPRGR